MQKTGEQQLSTYSGCSEGISWHQRSHFHPGLRVRGQKLLFNGKINPQVDAKFETRIKVFAQKVRLERFVNVLGCSTKNDLLFTQVKRIQAFHRRSKSLTEEREGKIEDKKNAQLCPRVFLLTPKMPVVYT